MRRVCALLIVVLSVTGCGNPNAEKPQAVKQPYLGKTLVAGLLGESALLPALRSQVGEWSATSGAELSFREVDDKSLAIVDVLIFPGERMGDLIDRDAIVVLPEEWLTPPIVEATQGDEGRAPATADAFDFEGIATSYREQVIKYGDDCYGLPIGGSALVLAYRRDAFENEQNKAAAKAVGINLEPPKTWEELDLLAKFFQGRDWDGDGQAKSGIALAWGADTEGVANAIYFSRAASLGQHRDQYTFMFNDRVVPRVSTPPFIEALKAHTALAKFGPTDAIKYDAEAARSAFRSGKVALLIDRAESATSWSKGKPVAVAPLPGSLRVYNQDRKNWEDVNRPNQPAYLPRGGGWLVGVAKGTANREAAIDFAKYLASPDVTNRLRSDRGFPMVATRTKQLVQGLADSRSAPGVEIRPWSDSVSRTVNAVRVVVGLRIPDAAGYLNDLTGARLSAGSGKDIEAVMKDLTEAWNARTKPLGLMRQSWHYRRTLNKFVTEPTMPPRD